MSYNPYDGQQQGGQPGYPQPGGHPQPGGYPQPGWEPQPGGYPQQTVKQPGQMGGMMPQPAGPPGCPEGLEYLTQVDQMLIHQKVEMLGAFTSVRAGKKYTIMNSLGQKVYFAVEDTDCCTRNCCDPSRWYYMKIMDHNQREVIHLDRPLRCHSCCFPCCLQEMEVLSGHSLLGVIKQNWSIFTPSLDIMNEGGNTVLKIEGPACTWSLCDDVSFDVLSADGNEKVGKITKQWTGLLNGTFTDADNFGVSFPMDLDVKMKATLLGAAFLIDFLFLRKEDTK